jgi:type IV pilus assembly protein PilX
VLIVSLLFLMVLTILGVNAMNSTLMEEKMAGNAVDRDTALQAAEAALRAGERDVEANKITIINAICNGSTTGCWYDPGTSTSPDKPAVGANPGDNCPNGYCTPREHDPGYDGSLTKTCATAGHVPNRWEDCASGDAAYANAEHVWVTGSGKYQEYDDISIVGIAQTPRYIVEYLGHRPNANEYSVCDTDNSNPDPTKFDPNHNDEPINGGDIESVSWPYCTSDSTLFRITAMGYGTNINTRIMLQSTYLVAN